MKRSTRSTSAVNGDKTRKTQKRKLVKEMYINLTLLEEKESQEERIEKLDILELRKYFTVKLVGQDITIRKIAAVLYSFNQRSIMKNEMKNENERVMILPLLFSGVSGTGKTESVKILKECYGVKNQQYIYFDLSRITDPGQFGILLGSGPGLVGYGQFQTMPQMLNSSMKEEIPSVILLHLDELDKAHPDLLTILINFMETGKLTSTSNINFQLPPETRLIIVFTANYGAQEIKDLSPALHYNEARKSIVSHMESDGIALPIIGRLPHIFPYFPLDRETMRKLARQMIGQMFQEVDYEYRNYFTTFQCSGGDNERLVKSAIHNYLSNIDTALGMRGLKNAVNMFKRDLCSDIMSFILEQMPTISLPLSPPPSLDLLTVNRDSEFNFDQLFQFIQDNRTGFSPSSMLSIRNCISNKKPVQIILVKYKDIVMHSLVY